MSYRKVSCNYRPPACGQQARGACGEVRAGEVALIYLIAKMMDLMLGALWDFPEDLPDSLSWSFSTAVWIEYCGLFFFFSLFFFFPKKHHLYQLAACHGINTK